MRIWNCFYPAGGSASDGEEFPVRNIFYSGMHGRGNRRHGGVCDGDREEVPQGGIRDHGKCHGAKSLA